LQTSIDPTHSYPRGTALQVVAKLDDSQLAFYSVHLTSPRYGLQNVLDRRTLINFSRTGLLVEETGRRWKTAQAVQGVVASQNLPAIIAGDFNMPTESALYRKVWGGYANAFTRTGLGYGWTERADVKGVPVRVRIDHVLSTAGLEPRLCKVGPDIGSDHLPLLADIAITQNSYPKQ
jgi:endonuclease/exonuclease/phosphatase family metal-dependent hydrolase